MVSVGRRHWLDDESPTSTTRTCTRRSGEVVATIAGSFSRSSPHAVVLAIAAWRERAARAKDLPRQRIVRDDVLMEIAANRPTTVDMLKDLPRVSLDRASAQAIADAVKEALALPASELPVLEPVKDLPKGIPAIVDLLRVLLKQVSDEHDISPRLIANGDDLEAVALDDRADAKVLTGWRRELFGEKALALKRGELVLGIRGRRVIVEPRIPAATRP